MKQIIKIIIGFSFLTSEFALADINFAVAGDIMLGNRLTGKDSVDPTFLEEVKPFLKNVDIAFANLEGPIGGNIAERKPCSNSDICHTFSQPYDAAKVLKDVGFNVLSVANNHAYDLGQSGKAFTIQALNQENISFVGYPEQIFTKKLVKGKSIGFVAFSANRGLPDYRNLGNVKPIIEHAKQNSDFLIVSMHAGCEGGHWMYPAIEGDEVCFGENRGNPLKFAKNAIDWGADLVIGHGPHVPRGIAQYKSKPIFLSLGNFATAKGISVSGKAGIAPLFKFSLSDNLEFKDFHIISFKQTFDKGPKLDKNQEALLIVDYLTKKLKLLNASQ